MIAYIVTGWIGQAALLIAGMWFMNGLRKAILRPRVTYVMHTKVEGYGTLIAVRRQELLPPWRTLEESWLLGIQDNRQTATRESDGKWLSDGTHDDIGSPLTRRLHALVRVNEARTKETDRLTDSP